MVATDFKRLFLRGISWDATDASITLTAALKAAARAQLTATATGATLIGTAGNGHSVTFQLPSSGQGASPQDITELCEELITRYDAAVVALVASGVASPSDDQILTEMLALMTAATEVYSDFTQMRYGGVPA